MHMRVSRLFRPEPDKHDGAAAQVVSVDISIDPPSFGVQLEATGAIRDTEAPRLRPRQLGDAAPQSSQPAVAAMPAAGDSSAPAVANGAAMAVVGLNSGNMITTAVQTSH